MQPEWELKVTQRLVMEIEEFRKRKLDLHKKPSVTFSTAPTSLNASVVYKKSRKRSMQKF